MRSTIVYFFIVALIFSFGFIEQYDNVSETNQIESLLNQRIDIINTFLYGDDKDLEILEKALSVIEADKLLETDMEILTHIYYNPTEYERTNKVAINKVKKIEVVGDTVNMLAELKWNIISGEDLPIETSLVKDYNISCIVKDKKMYLTNMKFVE